MSWQAVVFAAVFVTLYAAHEVGDHWVQTDAQACRKGRPGWPGRLAAARHVASLTATKLVAVAVAAAVLGLDLAWGWVAVALGVDAVSHWWADRRTTLHALAAWLDRTGLVPGKRGFAELGDGAAAPTGTGAYALDQSWHIAWLWVAALIASIGSGVA